MSYCVAAWFDAKELPEVGRAYRRSRDGKPADMAAEEVARVLDNRWR